MNNNKLSDILRKLIEEEWDKDVEIKSTGEHADKTITQIKKEMEALKGKKPFNREQFSELLFALRAKQGWKKGKGATGTTEQITTMNRDELKELIKHELNEVTRDKSEHQIIHDVYYTFSDGVYGLLDMTTDSKYRKDQFVKKTFRSAKKLLMDLETHLNKNYEGWD
tara:strand:+ start:103 stop:603 length:501 start_codon:yes stop_codon:yes gene_type:complete